MKIQDSQKVEMHNTRSFPKELPDLSALCDGHIAREFADLDVDATMETMVAEPYVYCVPVMTGGFPGLGVRRFYSEHFINQIPKDAKVTPISRTVGKDSVVDECILSFTHGSVGQRQRTPPSTSKPDFVAKLDRSGISAVLTAESGFEVRPRLATALSRDPEQLSDAPWSSAVNGSCFR